MFESAFRKLVLVYMAFVLAISILFSVVLYQVSVTALQRGLRAPGPNSPFSLRQNPEFEEFRLLRYEEQKSEILSSIIFLNIAVLIAGGLISYYLAKRTLEPIQQAMERQARFTADAAHELRTPLSVMRAESEVTLRDKQLTKQQAVIAIESNLEEAIRLQALTDTLLALSAGDQNTEISEVHIKDPVSDVISRLELAARDKKITIQNNVKDEIVLGNQDNLEQIITVLVDNAIKYSDIKGKVELSSILSKGNVNLMVVDHGIGIDKSDAPFIFDRFYRGETARTRSEINGHGLGLSLAKQLAEQNKAQISYQPTPKGGSTFTLKLQQAKNTKS